MNRLLDLRTGFRWTVVMPAMALVCLVSTEREARGVDGPGRGTGITDICIGDCDENGSVDVSELVLVTNIALELQDSSQCENLDGSADGIAINVVVEAVGNSIEGCQESTPTPTQPLGDTPTSTPTVTPTDGMPASCVLAETSTLNLVAAALAIPLQSSGSIDIVVDEQGNVTCDIVEFDPIQIVGVGFVCITRPEESCPSGRAFCPADGGSSEGIGIDVISDRVIGTCTSNQDCYAQCDTFCANIGRVPTDSGFGCELFCDGGERADQTCLLDEDCPGGSCNGRDNASLGNVCECQCIDTTAGDPPTEGDLFCNLGSSIIVEGGPPCGDGDIFIAVGTRCIPLTTASAEGIVNSANGRVCWTGEGPVSGPFCRVQEDCAEGRTCTNRTVPPSGVPATSTGIPGECSAIEEQSFTGLGLRGVVNFFGSNLGDLLTEVSIDCL